MRSNFHALPWVILLACATTPEEEEDMTTPVSCTVSANTTFEPMGRIVRGTGTIACETPAALSLKVCLYSKSLQQTSWGVPIQCISTAGSERTTLSTEVAISLPRGAAKMYRTVVSAQVDSLEQPSQASASITAP